MATVSFATTTYNNKNLGLGSKQTHTHTHTDNTPDVVFGVVVFVVVAGPVSVPNMAMAAQEKGQEEEEERLTKSDATHATTRYRTHVSPPKSYHQSTKM